MPALRIRGSHLVSDHAGIVLHNASGTELAHNYIAGHNWNSATPGDGGLVLDATSNDNVIRASKFYLNAPHVIDDGTGNYFSRNRYIDPIP